MITDVGPVEVRAPRDTVGTFEPQIVRKWERRLADVEEMILSLSAKILTDGETSMHLAEGCGADDRVYPVLFVDAINVKIREGGKVLRLDVPVPVSRDRYRDASGIREDGPR